MSYLAPSLAFASLAIGVTGLRDDTEAVELFLVG